MNTNKYTIQYNSFDELCENINTMEELMIWFKVNVIKWPDRDKYGTLNVKPFRWPDDIVRNKIASCTHQAVLEHYFCQRKKIEHVTIAYIRFRLCLDNTYMRRGHHNVIYKTENGWWAIFDYHGGPHNNKSKNYEEMKTSCIREPYDTFQEAAIEYNKKKNEDEAKLFQDKKTLEVFKSYLPSNIYIFNEKMYKVLDKNYNNPDTTIRDMYGGGGYTPLINLV